MVTALPVVIESPVNEATEADVSVVAVVETLNVGAACVVVAPVCAIFTNAELVLPLDDDDISNADPVVKESALIATVLPVVIESPVNVATLAEASLVAVVETANVAAA